MDTSEKRKMDREGGFLPVRDLRPGRHSFIMITRINRS